MAIVDNKNHFHTNAVSESPSEYDLRLKNLEEIKLQIELGISAGNFDSIEKSLYKLEKNYESVLVKKRVQIADILLNWMNSNPDLNPVYVGNISNLAIPLYGKKNSKYLIQIVSRLYSHGEYEFGSNILYILIDNDIDVKKIVKITNYIKNENIRFSVLNKIVDVVSLKISSGEDKVVRDITLGYLCRICGRLEDSKKYLEDAWEKNKSDEVALSLSETYFWLDNFEMSKLVLVECSDPAKFIIAINLALASGDGREAIRLLSLAETQGVRVPVALRVWAKLAGGDVAGAFDVYWEDDDLGSIVDRVFPGKSIRRETLERCLRSGVLVSGRTVVICSGGLGDEIRWAKYYNDMASMFDNVTFLCDERLAPLLSRSYPGLNFKGIRKQEGRGYGGIPLLDRKGFELLESADNVAQSALLMRFVDWQNSSAGALQICSYKKEKWKSWLDAKRGERPVVGLFWKSTKTHFSAVHKRIELNKISSILASKEVLFLPLQYEINSFEMQCLKTMENVEFPDGLDAKSDIEDLAAIIGNIDLLLALPGTTQHLAGALGADVLCCCHPYEASWRRMPMTGRDMWAHTVVLVTGEHSLGMSSAIANTISAFQTWLSSASTAAN